MPPSLHRLSISVFILGSVVWAEPLPDQRTEPLAGVAKIELGRTVVETGGRQLTYVRIRPPVLAARPAAPAVSAAAKPTPEEQAAEARRATKTHENITLMGTVYADPEAGGGSPALTELRLMLNEGETARAARVFVPFDLRLVDRVSELETGDTVYGFTVFLSVEPASALPAAEWPAEFLSAPGASGVPSSAAADSAASLPDYVFEGASVDAEAFDSQLRGLEMLLAHAALHRETLSAALAARVAAEAEAAGRAALAPPSPPPGDRTIYFWKIENPVAKP